MSPDPPFTAVQIYLNRKGARIVALVGVPLVFAVIGVVATVMWLSHAMAGGRHGEQARLQPAAVAAVASAAPWRSGR